MVLIKQKYEKQPKRQTGKQQGFVLVLALVLLAVLTLIGVSSMNSSNMELKTTANAQQHLIAFNAVQSAIEFAVSAVTTFDYQTNDPDLTQEITSHTVANTSALKTTADFAGCSVGVGSSLEEGKAFGYNFYNVMATGANSTGAATSLQTQGVRFPAAACN